MGAQHNGNGRYCVGRGKPPKGTQFKKGQSGNPSGRPKGAGNFAMLLKRCLNAPTVVQDHGRRRTVTAKEAFVEQFVQGALAGDIRKMEMLREEIRASEAKTARTRKVSEKQIADMVDRILGVTRDESAAENVETRGRVKSLDKETLRMIREEIYGLPPVPEDGSSGNGAGK